MRLCSPSAEATRTAGRLLGTAIDAEGALLALEGELGAGKTLLVKGLAEGLGLAPAQVSSPTFVIANSYPLPGAALLVHVDLYRLASLAELEGTGFLDWLEPGNVVAVEWADRLPDALPRERLTIRLASPRAAQGAGDSQRTLNAIASGPGAGRLVARWRSAVEGEEESHGLRFAPD